VQRRACRALLRAAVVVAVTAASLVALAAPAAAHSTLESSDPAAGSSVPASPRHIVLTFSEDPDAKLSLVGVIDSSGATVPGVSAPEAVPDEKLQLRVTPSRPLDDGVYTVNWRVVSAVDGHVETVSARSPRRAARSSSSCSTRRRGSARWRRRANGCSTRA
jgi:methionine-rich copper-binding protein CopC